MRVLVNGADTSWPTARRCRPRSRRSSCRPRGRGVAVAVDAEVVPRGQWGAHELQEGARVEILRAIQGG